MKNKILIGILTSRMILLLGYVGIQEKNIASGTKVLLETTPVDPRDFFRGDYVILGYEIGNTSCELNENEGSVRENMGSGRTVYVLLDIDEKGIATARGCQTHRPIRDSDGLFIKGRIAPHGSGNIAFGIEKYFVQEGTGKPLEDAIGTMNMKVSIARNGQARITGYEFVDELILPVNENGNGN